MAFDFTRNYGIDKLDPWCNVSCLNNLILGYYRACLVSKQKMLIEQKNFEILSCEKIIWLWVKLKSNFGRYGAEMKNDFKIFTKNFNLNF
jgi:hypothetical protein